MKCQKNSNILKQFAYNIKKGVDIMCIIKNGNDEYVKFNEGMFFEVIEHYFENKLISYNLILEEELIESYDDEEIAVFAMQEISRLIDEGKRYIDMEKVNLIIEA